MLIKKPKISSPSIIKRNLIIILFLTLFLIIQCDYNNPVHRNAVKLFSWAFVIILALVFCAISIAYKHPEIAWMILGFLSFSLIPEPVRKQIFFVSLVSFSFGSTLVILIGELEWQLPQFPKYIIYSFIAFGLFFIMPWGIAFTIKSGIAPIERFVAPPLYSNPTFYHYLIWFGLKVLLVLSASYFLDSWLKTRGIRIILRMFLRSLLIWFFALFPFPRVFAVLWADFLMSGSISSILDGIIDLTRAFGYGQGVIAALLSACLLLFSVPGIYTFLAENCNPPIGAMLTLFFVSLAARVYFFMVKCEIPFNWMD